MNQRAAHVYFCEMSDVDGMPIDEHAMYDFIRMYQEAIDAAYVPKPLSERTIRGLQRTWVDDRNARMRREAKLALQDANHAAMLAARTATPRLVSKFSWDDDDGGKEQRRRLSNPYR